MVAAASVRVLTSFFCLTLLASAQAVLLYPADKTSLPTTIDGNSPSFWSEKGFHLFTSTGDPEMISVAPGLDGPWDSQHVDVSAQNHLPLWIESAWRDSDGTIFGWYHHEPAGVCGNGLTAPKIGAVVSYDGGKTITDLGIVLESGLTPDCSSENGFFAGGHGDFSVVLGPEGKYFFFFFTNYIGGDDEQGVAVARLAFADRFHPAGAVYKYHNGKWDEPGIGGRMTAVFPAATNWQQSDTDSFWGPSVHWNTELKQYVMLLNRACCDVGWPQYGVYMSFAQDLNDPSTWTTPFRILEGQDIEKRPGFYPQVVGLGEGETDSLAGERARLFVHGESNWELVFVAGGKGSDATVPSECTGSPRVPSKEGTPGSKPVACAVKTFQIPPRQSR